MEYRFIAGPCVIESAELLDVVAQELVGINDKLGTDIIFKASFDKANRTSIHSFRGPGLDKGLQMLADIKSKYGLRLLTDIHESYQAAPVGEVIDVIQIPVLLHPAYVESPQTEAHGVLLAVLVCPHRVVPCGTLQRYTLIGPVHQVGALAAGTACAIGIEGAVRRLHHGGVGRVLVKDRVCVFLLSLERCQ